MPEHVHLIISEPRKGTPSQSLQVLKQRVSRALRRRPRDASAQLSLPFCCREAEAPAFWQRRFYDFNVWSSGKLREKLNYMHRNPVQRRLVVHPKEWPWSSWSYYEKGKPGLIAIDTLYRGETSSTQREQPETSKPAPFINQTRTVRHPSFTTMRRLRHPPLAASRKIQAIMARPIKRRSSLLWLVHNLKNSCNKREFN